jgi:hypothetical protein
MNDRRSGPTEGSLAHARGGRHSEPAPATKLLRLAISGCAWPAVWGRERALAPMISSGGPSLRPVIWAAAAIPLRTVVP